MSISNIPAAAPFGFSEYTDTNIGATADGIKASSTVLTSVSINNTSNVATSYVKLYNVASGSVTVGSTVPDDVISVPANQTVTVVYQTAASPGKTFGNALSACCVTTGGTAGTISPSASVICTFSYI